MRAYKREILQVITKKAPGDMPGALLLVEVAGIEPASASLLPLALHAYPRH